MRNSRVLIPENFAEFDLLLAEAQYFDIARKCLILAKLIFTENQFIEFKLKKLKNALI